MNPAGLLACSLFVAFPSVFKQWLEEQTVFTELTATGIAPDFNWLPF
jgi:hypothetical protein